VRPWAADAVRAGGGTVVQPAEAEALVWTATGFEPGFRPADLVEVLATHEGIRWVQLPWAGVEPYATAGVLDTAHTWTSGKGVYAGPVAEHALALALAGLRHLKSYSGARSWTAQAGRTLLDGQVTIFGGGGITQELVGLLRPFRARTTVVRKHPAALAGVDRVVGWADRDAALAGADVVFLALALTPETEHFMGRAQFETMADHAWLVNVARGRHVVTDDLVEALKRALIGGAGLDVTEPEPLPDGHPLWDLPTCLITPHTANTYEMAIPLLTARITDNVRRYVAGEPLVGQVDAVLGY
jgi:phosphoglycerate dehydrogenase-like enzyme